MSDHPTPLKILDRLGKQELIHQINATLGEKYVFPEMAARMRAHLEAKMAAGAYDRIASALEFAETLTSDLQEISGDRHLHVVFDPKRASQHEKDKTRGEEEDLKRIESQRRRNFGFRKVALLKGNIGYLDIRRFVDPRIAGETAAAAMRFVAECDALIIDLRYNGGGNPGMVQLLCSYFFDSDRPIHLNSIYSRPEDTTWQYWTLPFVPGPRLPEVDLYLLTSGHTFSGAEELAYNMANLERATIVGERTAGGANPISIEILSEGFTIMVPHGRPINPITGDNWEGCGVQAHIETDQERALEVAHLEALRKRIERSVHPEGRQRLLWLKEEVEAHYRPLTLPEAKLEKYIGDYGERRVHLRDGKLYYLRRFIRYRMHPLSETLFWLEGPDSESETRVQFNLNPQGHAKELVALHPDGRRMSLVKRS